MAIKRRAVSIPTVVAALVVGVVAAPLLVPLAAVADAARGRFRFPSVRLWAFLVQFLALELMAVSVGVVLWVAFAFGRLLHTERAVAMHGRVQWWWAGQVLGAAGRTLGLRFEHRFDDPLAPGPLLVIGRHCSYGDALLPALLFGTHRRLQLRYVIARGLAWSPALDVFGHRLRNHFVDRGAGSGAELLAVSRIARGMDHDDAAVIFPEGQFFTPERHARVLARLEQDDPELAARAARLRNVLPPRPGGVLALLGGAPAHTDVVILGHVGFEGFSTVAELWRNVPLAAPVVVRAWRWSASEVPVERRARVDWLYDRWEELDQWIEDELAERAAPGGRR
ncbi:MAG: 1-acyl-sn-glycerol-3-phosphate acyltransferase [Acidimicrobiales bacterium]|nr:1-acyl-sn-glycerol-3-phosphate acyltransferase [Acidimicrobiales bacterium]